MVKIWIFFSTGTDSEGWPPGPPLFSCFRFLPPSLYSLGSPGPPTFREFKNAPPGQAAAGARAGGSAAGTGAAERAGVLPATARRGARLRAAAGSGRRGGRRARSVSPTPLRRHIDERTYDLHFIIDGKAAAPPSPSIPTSPRRPTTQSGSPIPGPPCVEFLSRRELPSPPTCNHSPSPI